MYACLRRFTAFDLQYLVSSSCAPALAGHTVVGGCSIYKDTAFIFYCDGKETVQNFDTAPTTYVSPHTASFFAFIVHHLGQPRMKRLVGWQCIEQVHPQSDADRRPSSWSEARRAPPRTSSVQFKPHVYPTQYFPVQGQHAEVREKAKVLLKFPSSTPGWSRKEHWQTTKRTSPDDEDGLARSFDLAFPLSKSGSSSSGREPGSAQVLEHENLVASSHSRCQRNSGHSRATKTVAHLGRHDD
ncbi:uncharacterized protein LY79DRAFT_654910 [Colletotrichum navitas]|uniref:Uncharacterized protein n=1 Tax=Colletotrichum navitas TaxID=681940 RepID=A0AAD8QD83_9PEZI|nr:uncharacterized protein LY79DRAFT_654910 [Colletotrichum navitas]KAK1600503.1 hypothetical protein LY79DRAFT_654910 [Colletotrichum navitas]